MDERANDGKPVHRVGLGRVVEDRLPGSREPDADEVDESSEESFPASDPPTLDREPAATDAERRQDPS